MGYGELRVPTAIAVTGADMALPAQDERTLPAVVLDGLGRRRSTTRSPPCRR